MFIVVGVERSLRLASELGDTQQKKKQDIIVQNVLRSSGIERGFKVFIAWVAWLVLFAWGLSKFDKAEALRGSSEKSNTCPIRALPRKFAWARAVFSSGCPEEPSSSFKNFRNTQYSLSCSIPYIERVLLCYSPP